MDTAQRPAEHRTGKGEQAEAQKQTGHMEWYVRRDCARFSETVVCKGSVVPGDVGWKGHTAKMEALAEEESTDSHKDSAAESEPPDMNFSAAPVEHHIAESGYMHYAEVVVVDKQPGYKVGAN